MKLTIGQLRRIIREVSEFDDLMSDGGGSNEWDALRSLADQAKHRIDFLLGAIQTGNANEINHAGRRATAAVRALLDEVETYNNE